MSWWIVTAAANALVSVFYFTIFLLIGRGLVAEGLWRRNRLALATAGIFLTCSFGHGIHLFHLLVDDGMADHVAGVRGALGSWPMALVDSLTAVVAACFLSLRLLARRHDAAGNEMYEDWRRRRQTALDLNDDVIQGLVTAKLALDLADEEEAALALERTLAAARDLVAQLLEPMGGPAGIKPGDLRRRAAAQVR
jgi:hypothetical protein